MKISTVLGSALAVLLIFSVISYAKEFAQSKDPKPATQSKTAAEVQGQAPQIDALREATEAARAGARDGLVAAEVVVPAQTYSATA